MKVINLHGVVGWDIMAKDVNEDVQASEGDLVFDMNSGGGYITEGVSIMNTIRSYKGGKTIARVSYSASMMTQIALACDEVQVYDNAIFMIHNAQGFAMGDHNEMTARAKHLKSMSGMLAKMYVNKTGKSEEEIQQLMDDETYMFGESIVDEGFADTLIDTDNEKDLALATENASLNFKKSMDAMEEEGLSASQLGDELKLCKNGCNLNGSETPSSEKIVNSNKGETVTVKEKAIQALLDTANTTIDTHKDEMAGKDTEISALNEKIVAFEASASAFETEKTTAIETAVVAKETSLKDEFKGIMAMVLEVDAPKDVALKMTEKSTLAEATVVCNDEMRSAGVTFGGGDTNTNHSKETNHGWGKIMKKEGK